MDTKRNMRGGFTVIELIMIIVILAVISVVVVISMSPYRNLQLEGAANKLMADIRYTQQLAMSKNGVYSILFEPASNRYTIYYFNGSSNVNIPDPLTHASPAQTSYSSGSYSGITLTSATFNSGAELRFTARGIPQDTSAAGLSSTGTVVITNEAGSITVSVAPDTGMVSKP